MAPAPASEAAPGRSSQPAFVQPEAPAPSPFEASAVQNISPFSAVQNGEPPSQTGSLQPGQSQVPQPGPSREYADRHPDRGHVIAGVDALGAFGRTAAALGKLSTYKCVRIEQWKWMGHVP